MRVTRFNGQEKTAKTIIKVPHRARKATLVTFLNHQAESLSVLISKGWQVKTVIILEINLNRRERGIFAKRRTSTTEASGTAITVRTTLRR